MTRFRRTSLPWLALAGVLALALSVAACGRKGPLEQPTAAVVEPGPGVGAVGADWDAQNQASRAAGNVTTRPASRPHDAVVYTAPAAKQRSVFDWLLD